MSKSSIFTSALIGDPDSRLYEAMIGIAERTLDEAGLAALFRELRVDG